MLDTCSYGEQPPLLGHRRNDVYVDGNTRDGRCRPLPQKSSGGRQLSLRIQRETIPTPRLGALPLGLALGSEKVLAGSGGKDAKSPLISEEPHKDVTMATTLGSAQTERQPLQKPQWGKGQFQGGRRGRQE